MTLKVKVKYSNWLPKALGVIAITLGRTIRVRLDYIDDLNMTHELIHVRQYAKYGFIGFMLRYAWGWLSHGLSYRRNPMEVEAYELSEQYSTPYQFESHEDIKVEFI
jgi:hypothetical protein